jgi:hypothetical protein
MTIYSTPGTVLLKWGINLPSAVRCRRARCLQAVGRVNKDIHLLADEDGQVALGETKNHLEHARINPLGAVAGERFFRHDARFETHRGEQRRDLPVAAELTDRRPAPLRD